MNKKEEDRMREIAAETIAASVTGRVEKILSDTMAEKVAHFQKSETAAREGADEATKRAGLAEARVITADSQLKDLRIAIVGQKTELDDLKIQCADLASQRDALAAEVLRSENELKTFASALAEKKIARLR